MEILVLGASGGCGKEVVQQAVARGHSITAFCRRKLNVQPPEESGKGNVLDKGFIEENGVGSEYLSKASKIQRIVNIGLAIGGLIGLAGVSTWLMIKE